MDKVSMSQSHGQPGPSDRIAAARMLVALRAGSDVRRRKVRRVRAAIRTAAYENALKLHVAIEKLVSDVSRQ